jgi:hypothetical protein
MPEMSKPVKKSFFLNHKKSSALVFSVVVHAVFIVIAVLFVAVSVIIKPEQTFEVADVKRPKMRLRKLQVPVQEQQKKQAPKLRQNIVAKPKVNIAIKMPEVIGVPGGTYGSGEGLGGLGFGFNFDMDLFGSSRGTGNELIGNFYDLKQTPDGKPTDIGEQIAFDKENNISWNPELQFLACKYLETFVRSGWNENRLSGFFKAPKQKFATTIMMPPMGAEQAPIAFGVEDQVEPSFWACHYKGTISAPETGRYRFCGFADDILVVRVGRKVVLDASWPDKIKRVSPWTSRDENSRKFPLDVYGQIGMNWLSIFAQLERAGAFDGAWIEAFEQVEVNGMRLDMANVDHHNFVSRRMVIGDWITLTKGQKVPIEILIAEIPGGGFVCRLLVEQESKEYNMVESDGGLRPFFNDTATTEIDNKELINKMGIDLREATLEGPVFGALINTPDK